MSRNKLPKETKDLYAEKYKMTMKEIKDDTDRETYHVLVKITILPKEIFRFSTIPVK